MRKKRLIALIICMVLIFSNVISAWATEGANIDVFTWTPEDFTYVSYEKLLYGCDYSRQFTIQGTAISGFSELGEQKLEQNKNLVIPAVDDEGETIVGVAMNAFNGRGLTSVTFPTGMMVDYDDTVTNKVTKRGNFVIAESAFANNQLTSVTLPEGVIACLPQAFNNNKIEMVKLPKTIWWLETMAFSNNRITTVNFPTTCDFQLEMHGLTFAKNFIQSVRLPDFTEVVNKHVFAWNTGKEPIAANEKDDYKTYTVDNVTYDAGVVYMYTDNAELEVKDRIHHNGKSTASQYSFAQKLVVNDGSDDTQNPQLSWNVNDFIIEGTVIKGLSESGIAKRATNKDLILPDLNKEGAFITEIASSSPNGYGLFAADGEGFDSVYLPSKLVKIGEFAFQNNGLKEVTFPSQLKSIGKVAFQTNNLTSIILPDTVTSLGEGAFATNPKLERINLSKGLTEIPASAFGGSDAKNWMTNLTSIELHEGITKIGSRAFAGNNFNKITMPSTLKEIGSYAFSTKNYLTTPTELELNEGLEVIGDNAFRNKVIANITLPKTVTKLSKNTFRKEYSDSTEAVVTKVYVSLQSQYEDKENFLESEYHKLYLTDTSVWTANDFTYGTESFELYPASEKAKKITVPAWVVTGLSEIGENKIKTNTDVVIPATDSNGKKVQGVGNAALDKLGITSLTLPKEVKATYDDNTWTSTGKGLTERGDFFIGASAFLGNKLTNLELPDGVIYIGGSAFKSNQLTTVRLPKSVMVIASQSFAANSISTLRFAEATDFALQIDNMAFGQNLIKSVQIPSNTEKLTKWAFFQNTGMEPVTSGNANEKQGGIVYMYKTVAGGDYIDHVDAGTSNVQKLITGTIPEQFTPWSVGDFTYDAEGITITGLSEVGKEKIKENADLILPKAGPTEKEIKALGDGENMAGIFVHAEGGKTYAPASVLLPKTLTEIGQQAFENHQLTEVTIPGSVKTIGKNAFRINQENLEKALTKVVLNEGLETIGQEAFYGNKITEIKLPGTVVLSAKNKSADCIFGNSKTPADPIVVLKVADKEKVEAWNTEFANSYSHILVYDNLVGTGWEAEDFTYDETTATLTGWSESGHAKRLTLRTLILPQKTPGGKEIVTIGAAAFKIPNDEVIVTKFGIDSPNGMTSVVIPETVTVIGEEAFSQNALTTVDLTGITSIGNSAFYGNDLVKVEMPDTVTELGTGAFATNDITELRLSKGVTIIPQGAFSMNIRMEQVEIPDTVTEIGATAFAGARLVSLTIPKSVVKIGTKAFHLHHLTSLTIPGNVKEIGESAFEGTYKATTLSTLVLEEGVESIGKYAFKEALLETVHFPESIKSVGEKPFLNNKGKDGSHVVEVTTTNPEHTNLEDDTYVVKYLGVYSLSEYENKVELPFTTTVYVGTPIEPKVIIDGLVEGIDFVVTYKNNVEVGTATVEITGIGQYEGKISKRFTISENPFAEENAKLKTELEKLKAEIKAHKCPTTTTPENTQKDTVQKEPVVSEKETESQEEHVENVENPEVIVEKDGNNKMIIGIVLGMIIGGSVVFLLTGKKKNKEEA